MQHNALIKWLESYVGILSDEEITTCLVTLGYFEDMNTTELDHKSFNQIHQKQKQKLLGITYTPPEIRKELTSKTLSYLSENLSIESCTICDPCCGSGTFSITLAEMLLDKGISSQVIFQNVIHFYDVDKLSVAVALVNMYRHFSTNHDINLMDLKLNCDVRNFFSTNIKFDAFITNPPYVKLQNLDFAIRESLKKQYSLLMNGSSGLSLFFLKKMFDDITESGMVAVITQNNFFTSNAGTALRESIQNHLWRIDNFGSEAIFGKVTAYTCLLYLTGRKQKTFGYRKLSSNISFNSEDSPIANSLLDASKWRLGTKVELDILKTLESKGMKLGDACRIWVGIATQLDKAFTVFQKNGAWVGTSPDGIEMEVESSIIKSLLRIADVTAEKQIHSNTRGVIYPYELYKGRARALEEKEFLEKYPKAAAYLLTWKPELLQRNKGRSEECDWFKWGRSQSMIPVRGKLLTKTFNNGPAFYFDETDSLFSNGYALTPKNANFDIKFIQQLLNSKIFFYYARLTSFEIQGGYQCYQKNFIERFCVPIMTLKQQQELLLSDDFEKNIEEYYGVNIPND